MKRTHTKSIIAAGVAIVIASAASLEAQDRPLLNALFGSRDATAQKAASEQSSLAAQRRAILSDARQRAGAAQAKASAEKKAINAAAASREKALSDIAKKKASAERARVAAIRAKERARAEAARDRQKAADNLKRAQQDADRAARKKASMEQKLNAARSKARALGA